MKIQHEYAKIWLSKRTNMDQKWTKNGPKMSKFWI